jgi:(2Fe-2S) ferredoxin
MKPRFFVCRGKSCRKREKKRKDLFEALSEIAAVEDVECQDVCNGPVVVFQINNQLTWFERVDSKKARRSLLDLATGGKVAKALRKRIVKTRKIDLK